MELCMSDRVMVIYMRSMEQRVLKNGRACMVAVHHRQSALMEQFMSGRVVCTQSAPRKNQIKTNNNK
jgi:hypothetical protein